MNMMNITPINPPAKMHQDVKTEQRAKELSKKDELKSIESYKTDDININNIKSGNTKFFDQINIFSDPMSLIKVYSGKSGIFPPDWHSSKVKASADIPNQDDLKPAYTEIKYAINKYPANFLFKENVKNVHLVGNLSCFGVNYDGTNSRDSLFIGITKNNEVEKTFHHELSSILLRNNPGDIDQYKWNSLSRGQNSSSSDAIKDGLSSVQLNPSLFEKGFLTSYSMSNPENDFNMYAENIFSGGKQFWDIVDKNLKVAEKTKIVVDFYEKLSPVFNEDYFRALAH